MPPEQLTIPSRVAVVEDEPDTRAILAERLGCSPDLTRVILKTGNYQVAKDSLAKGEAHIVAVDLFLEDEEPNELLEPDRPSGVRLCEFLKSLRWDVNVVLYSGHASPMLLSNCWLAGADTYLCKDFTSEPAAEEILRLARGEDASPWTYPPRTDLQQMQELIDRKSLLTPYQRRVHDLTVRGLDSRSIQSRINRNAECGSEHRTYRSVVGAREAIGDKLPTGWKHILNR